jgi:replicative DNA helicase
VSPEPRTLPHSLDAERSVLGAVLIENSVWPQAAVLTEEAFFRDSHKRLFRSYHRLAAKKSALDLVTVKADLENHGDLDEVGGPAYLGSLVDGVPRSTNVEYYAQVVIEHWQAREVIFRSNKTIAAAYERAEDISDVISSNLTDLSDLAAKAIRGGLVGGDVLARDIYQFLAEAEERNRSGKLSGVTTGLHDFDRMTDGFQAGDLIVIAGSPSQGKTALGVQTALAGQAAFFSLEMRRQQIGIRAIATLARVDGWKMRKGELDDEDMAKVATALERFSESGLYIDDASSMTVAEIRAKAQRHILMHPEIDRIVVDYIQIVSPGRTQRQAERRDIEVANIAKGLKEIARELNRPVIAMAQLKRLPKGQEPTLADLRESGAIEQVADVVGLIWRPDGETVARAGTTEIILAKQRMGPQGRLQFWWTPEQTRFSQMDMNR